MSKPGRRRKRYKPAGAEFDGKCRQLERIANELELPLSEIRLAENLFFNGQQWTIRSVFEHQVGDRWIELEWNPTTHSISVDRPVSHVRSLGTESAKD